MAKSGGIKVLRLQERHSESMIDLLHELFGYYNPNEPVEREQVRRHFLTNLVPDNSACELLVAETPDHDVIGFAAISYFHSLVDPRPEKAKQCLLKELYVRHSFRDRNIGEMLMLRLIADAREAGCMRVDWNVKTHNHAGIRFYERFGAHLVEDRASYRIIL